MGWGGKGFGGGKGFDPYGWGGKGKGKGKGHRTFKPEQKVWIGNLPPSVTFKELQPHLKQAGECKWCECFTGNGQGTGVGCYATAEEASTAIATLNGSELGGQAIEVDVWTTKPKEGK